MRLWERICEDLQIGRGFMRLWERICGFTIIHETLGEDSEEDFTRLWQRIHETLGEDS